MQVNIKILKLPVDLQYSAKFWREDILADLADLPATAKNLPFKISTLNNNAINAKISPSKCVFKLHLPKISPSKILRYVFLALINPSSCMFFKIENMKDCDYMHIQKAYPLYVPYKPPKDSPIERLSNDYILW